MMYKVLKSFNTCERRLKRGDIIEAPEGWMNLPALLEAGFLQPLHEEVGNPVSAPDEDGSDDAVPPPDEYQAESLSPPETTSRRRGGSR